MKTGVHGGGLLPLAAAAIVMASAVSRATAAHPEAPGGETPRQLLGRLLFFDATLSEPQGQSCASCHAPEAGFKFPGSTINRHLGVPPGAIPTRFGPRAVQTISYAAFCPPGPPI